jgi:hypothetical protein
MNDVFNNVMTFINKNTYLLIGICVFLILVLIGYLIDNSVKSKRVRKDIKNKDQVPENIKEDIIKEANEKKEKELNVQIEEPKKEDIINQNNQNMEVNEDEAPLNLDASLSIDKPLNLEKDPSLDDVNSPLNIDNNINEPLSLDTNSLFDEENKPSVALGNDILEDNLSLDNSEKPIVESSISSDQDPDANIMLSNSKDGLYSNDKTLLEILSEVDSSKLNNSVDNKTIFGNKPSIEINTNVEKEKVEIEPKNSTDSSDNELDNIMKKLSSMNNSDDEDNYTNIF